MSTLLGTNVFEMQNDSERRLAHRSEIKRALAEIAVRKARISELKNIAAKLDQDSETAADSHSEQAGRLQDELKEIDQRHIDCVLAGTELPAKMVARRLQILDEIVQLNRILDDRCQANKRAAVPILREIQELTMQTTSEGALTNQLAGLCSPGLRQKRMLNQHLVGFMQGALRDADRVVAIEEHNVRICKQNKDAANEAVQKIKLDDWQTVRDACAAEVTRLLDSDREIERAALAE